MIVLPKNIRNLDKEKVILVKKNSYRLKKRNKTKTRNVSKIKEIFLESSQKTHTEE